MQLPTAVNIADNLKKDYGFVNIDEGNYKAVIVASGTMPSITQGQPDDYFVKVIITEGQFKDTVFDVRLGFLNHNPCNPSKSADFTWAMAAAKTIASIADAVGLAGAVTDTVQVHNKPFLIEVKNKEGKPYQDKNTGETKQGKGNSYIKSYHKLPAVGGFGAPAFAAQNAPQVVAQATAPSPFVQPAAVASPPSQAPWAR
jgi:hypothetical protein